MTGEEKERKRGRQAVEKTGLDTHAEQKGIRAQLTWMLHSGLELEKSGVFSALRWRWTGCHLEMVTPKLLLWKAVPTLSFSLELTKSIAMLLWPTSTL
jgi:hypothetical protein